MQSVLPPDHRVQLGRIRFRRAIALMLMTLVLPGSAQLVAGRKQVGRVAMRIWFALVLLTVLFVIVAMSSHMFVLKLMVDGFWTDVLRFGLMIVAIGWAYLFVDAWRIGEPLALAQRQRLAMVGINGFLCFAVAGSLLYAAHLVAVEKAWVS